MDTLELVLVRHGESYANRDNTNEIDSELTERGIQQAERLAPWLAAHFDFTALYSSPLIRARKTAEIAAQDLGIAVIFRDDLREVDFNLGEVLPQFADPLCALTELGVLRPHMLSRYTEFCGRVTKAFTNIIAAHPSGKIGVFSHGGVIGTFCRKVFGGHQVSVYADNSSVTLLRWERLRWHLVYTNCMEHLH